MEMVTIPKAKYEKLLDLRRKNKRLEELLTCDQKKFDKYLAKAGTTISFLQQDKERLDWLENDNSVTLITGDDYVILEVYGDYPHREEGISVREAVDCMINWEEDNEFPYL